MIIEKLKTGDFNHMKQVQQLDGSVIITLTKRGDNHVYRMAVKNLYKEAEEVLWEEVTGGEE